MQPEKAAPRSRERYGAESCCCPDFCAVVIAAASCMCPTGTRSRPGRIRFAPLHLALELRPVEAAAIKMKHASAAVGSIAETGYLKFESEREQKPSVDLRHGGLLMTGIRHVLRSVL